MDSEIEQFIFFWLKDSEAAINIAISFTFNSIAVSKPRKFGTRTGYSTPGTFSIFW